MDRTQSTRALGSSCGFPCKKTVLSCCACVARLHQRPWTGPNPHALGSSSGFPYQQEVHSFCACLVRLQYWPWTGPNPQMAWDHPLDSLMKVQSLSVAVLTQFCSDLRALLAPSLLFPSLHVSLSFLGQNAVTPVHTPQGFSQTMYLHLRNCLHVHVSNLCRNQVAKTPSLRKR